MSESEPSTSKASTSRASKSGASNGTVSSHESRILELVKSKPQGISEQDIQTACPEITVQQYRDILNKSLKDGTLNVLQTRDKKLLYKFSESALKLSNCSNTEEKVVYQIIEKVGNKGIWLRDIRVQANLSQQQAKKVLKSMEAKKMIKTVNNVNQPRKPWFMLYELEPDPSITGGTWYNKQEFEVELVDVLSQQCERFLKEKAEAAAARAQDGPLAVLNESYVSTNDVLQFISNLGICKVDLSVQDINSILAVVVLDNKAEKIVTPNGTHMYKWANKFLSMPGLFKITCGICPIAEKCNDVGDITPTKCSYLTEWLNDF